MTVKLDVLQTRAHVRMLICKDVTTDMVIRQVRAILGIPDTLLDLITILDRPMGMVHRKQLVEILPVTAVSALTTGHLSSVLMDSQNSGEVYRS